jgi:hypothetical protein
MDPKASHHNHNGLISMTTAAESAINLENYGKDVDPKVCQTLKQHIKRLFATTGEYLKKQIEDRQAMELLEG